MIARGDLALSRNLAPLDWLAILPDLNLSFRLHQQHAAFADHHRSGVRPIASRKPKRST